MNNDIVTRLRMSADLVDGFPKALAKNLFPTSWLSEAADEIERLRADVKRWRELAHSEHYAWSQCPLNCVCLSNLYRKKMRDE